MIEIKQNIFTKEYNWKKKIQFLSLISSITLILRLKNFAIFFSAEIAKMKI